MLDRLRNKVSSSTPNKLVKISPDQLRKNRIQYTYRASWRCQGEGNVFFKHISAILATTADAIIYLGNFRNWDLTASVVRFSYWYVKKKHSTLRNPFRRT